MVSKNHQNMYVDSSPPQKKDPNCHRSFQAARHFGKPELDFLLLSAQNNHRHRRGSVKTCFIDTAIPGHRNDFGCPGTVLAKVEVKNSVIFCDRVWHYWTQSGNLLCQDLSGTRRSNHSTDDEQCPLFLEATNNKKKPRHNCSWPLLSCDPKWDKMRKQLDWQPKTWQPVARSLEQHARHRHGSSLAWAAHFTRDKTQHRPSLATCRLLISAQISVVHQCSQLYI